MARIELISLECPSCGGTMQYEKGQAKAECPYCGKAVIVSEEQKPQAHYALPAPAQQPKKSRRTVMGTFSTIGAIILAVLAAIGIKRMNEITADPFEFVRMEFSGVSGSGTARLVNSSEGELKNVRFTLDRPRGLSNGESVSVTAKKLGGYRWTRSKRSFTVSGLDEALSSLAGLNDDVFAQFYEASGIQIEKAWKGVSSGGAPVEWSAEKHKLYLLVSDGSARNDNLLYDTYKTTVRFPNGEEREFYQAVCYTNVLKKADGSISADYSSASMENWQLGYNLGFAPSDAFYGWESLREMELEFEGMQGYRIAD
jgi:predicted RNA-binding Zn-ribbon protein involved in translation (DUF1610 family)